MSAPKVGDIFSKNGKLYKLVAVNAWVGSVLANALGNEEEPKIASTVVKAEVPNGDHLKIWHPAPSSQNNEAEPKEIKEA